MIRTVKECDFCQAQIDWTDMQKDGIPDGWRTITVTVADDMGDASEPFVIEICPLHKGSSIANIVGTCLEA